MNKIVEVYPKDDIKLSSLQNLFPEVAQVT